MTPYRNIAKTIRASWHLDPPLEGFEALDAIEKAIGVHLPADMKWFYQFVGNGGEGTIKGRYLWMHRADEMLELQARYDLVRWAPRVFMFAQDGDEGYGLDLRRNRDGCNYPVVRFSLATRDEDLMEDVGRSFRDFMERHFGLAASP